MIHALHRVADFQVVGPHRLRVVFRDGMVREIDFRPVLAGALYEVALQPGSGAMLSAVPRHREIPDNLVKKICRDLGIPPPGESEEKGEQSDAADSQGPRVGLLAQSRELLVAGVLASLGPSSGDGGIQP